MTGKKKILIGTGFALVLAVIIALSVNARRKNEVIVETSKVSRRAELVAVITATGEIKPKEYVELQAETTGVITELFVSEGDTVEKGALLLKIDPVQTELELRAQQAVLASSLSEARNQEAQIAVQQTNVQRDISSVRLSQVEAGNARDNLGLARKNFERKQELFEDNLIAADLYDNVKTELMNAESSVAAAEARLEQAQAQLAVSKVVLEQARISYQAAMSRVEQQRANLRRSQDLLSKTIIRSPLAGVITQMNVEAGERAVPGTLNNPAATLMVIADLSVIEAEVEVDETDIVDLELGQRASIKVDALPNNPIDGVVTKIGSSPIQEPGQQEEAKDFEVVIQLKNPPASLRPGLSCTGEIIAATRTSVLAIPIQALTVREFPVDENGGLIREEKEGEDSGRTERKEFEGVFEVVGGEVRFVPLETGILGETEIEVLLGLEPGAEIVTGSYKTLRVLRDGDHVKVKEEREE